MILQTTHLNNGRTTHTFVQVGQIVLCHSNNGREVLVFPAKHTGTKYEISEWSEIEDFGLIDKVQDIVDEG